VNFSFSFHFSEHIDHLKQEKIAKKKPVIFGFGVPPQFGKKQTISIFFI